MEQRRLRLGDILDDYCPRERRVTNHVVVAMIEDEIEQTRCSTCDAEHPYKGGKAPRRKKAESVAVPLPTTVVTRPPDVESEPESNQPTVPASEPAPPVHADAMPAPSLDEASLEEGPVHRPLIRATLPRPEGIEDRASPSGVHDSPEQQSGERELPWRLRGQRARRAWCWRTRWERRRRSLFPWRSAAGRQGSGARGSICRRLRPWSEEALALNLKALLERSQPPLVIVETNGLKLVGLGDDPDRIPQIFHNDVEMARRHLATRSQFVPRSMPVMA